MVPHLLQNNMKTTVLDAKTLGSDLDLSIFDDAVIYASTTPEETINHIADSEIVIVNKVKLTHDILEHASNLRLICIAATGYDNIDIDYCKSRGIAVCNVCGYSTQSVAQLTVAMVLSLSVHLNEYCEFVKNGNYTNSGVANKLEPVYNEIFGKTWGIVGLGNIGKQVAKTAEAMGCNILAFKRTPQQGFNCVTLNELMEKSDIISVHLPASKDTAGIISKEMISKMKKNAVLINVARGAVVDEQALCDAVINKKIAGIGIDVYAQEPFSKEHCYNKIKDYPNVLLTPHIAWGAFESRQRCINEIKLNIDSFKNDERRNRIV